MNAIDIVNNYHLFKVYFQYFTGFIITQQTDIVMSISFGTISLVLSKNKKIINPSDVSIVYIT